MKIPSKNVQEKGTEFASLLFDASIHKATGTINELYVPEKWKDIVDGYFRNDFDSPTAIYMAIERAISSEESNG